MALSLPRNPRVAGSPGGWLRRYAHLPPVALAAMLATLTLAAGSGFAQEAAGGLDPGKSTPGLRVKSVIMPKPVIVDPSRRKANAGAGDPAGSPGGAAIAAPRTFRIGIVPRGETVAFLRALEPFRTGIAETLHRPAEILPFADFTAMIDAQMLRRIDLGFYSASAYALADTVCRCLDPLVAPAAADGTMAFHGIILARRQSAIASVDDLRDREIAAGAADSVGSRRIQMAELSAGGIDAGSFFSDVITARNGLEAIRMVCDERADAAFAWSSLAGEADAGYSRGPLAYLVARGELNMDEIAIIWRSRPIAHAPVAVAKSLPGDVRRALAGFFVRLADSDPETYDRLERDYGGGYRIVRREDYAGALVLARPDAAVGESGPDQPIQRTRPQPPGIGGQGVN